MDVLELNISELDKLVYACSMLLESNVDLEEPVKALEKEMLRVIERELDADSFLTLKRERRVQYGYNGENEIERIEWVWDVKVDKMFELSDAAVFSVF